MNLGCWSFEKTGTHDTEAQSRLYWGYCRRLHPTEFPSVHNMQVAKTKGSSLESVLCLPFLAHCKNMVRGDVAEMTEYSYARSGKLKWPKTGISTAIKSPVQTI